MGSLIVEEVIKKLMKKGLRKAKKLILTGSRYSSDTRNNTFSTIIIVVSAADLEFVGSNPSSGQTLI